MEQMKKKPTTCFKPKFKLNIQYFAAEDDTAADDVNIGSDDGQNTNTSQTADNDQNTGDDKSTDDKSTELTADELKQIAEANVLKSLGVDSLKDAKTQLDSWKEYEDSKKTEEEKVNDRITQLETDNSAKDSTIFELNAKLSASQMDVKADSVDDAIVLAKAMTDKDDKLSIEDALKSVVEKYPHFTKSADDTDTTPTGVFPGTKPSRISASADDAFEAIKEKYKKR